MKERQNKLNVVSDTSEQLCSLSQSKRSGGTSNHNFGKLVFFFFFPKTNTENNLTVAGTFHATKNKVDINHLSNLKNQRLWLQN